MVGISDNIMIEKSAMTHNGGNGKKSECSFLFNQVKLDHWLELYMKIMIKVYYLLSVMEFFVLFDGIYQFSW